MAMSLLESVRAEVRINLADPVNGTPTAPGGPAQSRVNTIWGWGLWGLAIVAAFALLGALIVAMVNHQQGRPNDGVGRAAVIAGVCVIAGSIGGMVGAITGA